MNLTDASERQFEIGIDMFIDGHSVSYHEVVFSLTREGTFEINSYVDAIHQENISMDNAKAKIERSKKVFEDLRLRSGRFAGRVSGLEPKYVCCFDYGTAAVAIAKEENGIFSKI